ncbi:MAG TPA: MFS transporter [Myxococcota bacterium]|nr:MFS transporter [Myxococcota bacterium]
MTQVKKWYRTFLIIFSGQAFSLLGSSAVNFALVWWLTAQTGSASILAYASIAAILPQAVISPFAGPFIDRWSRRATMIVADMVIAATSVILLFLFQGTTPQVAAIMAIIAVRSAGAAFHTPASQAAVPMYVPAERLMQVAGWNFFLASGVAMVGPVLGAFLMTTMSIQAVIAIDIAGAVIAVASLLSVRIPHPQRPAGTPEVMNFAKEFLEGWRELVQHRGLFHLTLTIAVVTLLYMPLNALFPLMTFSHFKGDAAAASYVEVGFGAGMLVGSLGIGILSSRLSAVRIIAGGILVLGALLGLSGLLPASAFWVFVVLCVLMGMSVPAFSAPLTALFQGAIDPAKLGRVMSLYMTLALLVAPVGLLVAGPLAEITGVAHWFAISGALIATTGLIMWLVPSISALDVKPASPQDVDVESEG